ncbi:restriction endonuclease subunit S [Streptomyces viridosporus]|uniref:restriction endonuclease subunit S n=1 Tax=Streptomyces viridosporus TaxID=67581 RepID=UPI003329A75B
MTVVPDGWMLYTPHDIAGLAKDALVIGPFGSNLKTSDYRDEGVPLIFVKDIRAEDFSRPRAYVSTAKAAELEAHQVLPGDILITKMGDPPGDVALYDSDVPGIITADCIRLRPTAGFDRKYLVHSLRTPNARRQIDAITTGAAQKKVSLDRFRTRLHISAPPLAEQKRIAAVLDQVDTLRAKRREAINLLDDLAQAIFLDMFGNPVANEKKWPVHAFGEVCETRLGKMLDASQQTGMNARPYLRNANVQWFHIDTTDLLEMDFSEADRITYGLAPGDVLICEGGEPGRAAVWRGEISDCYFQKALHRARPRRGSANPEYIAWLLRMFSILGGLSDHISTATIAHLTGAKLKKLPIPTPPVLMQEKFARRIKQVEAAKQRHSIHLAVLDEIFVSLQQRAFSGTLWDHDGGADAA